MQRTVNSFSVLQVTAAIIAMTVVLWSLGLSAIQFAEAANVISYSDTLSTSEPSVAANHTIEFTTPSGVANGETITIDLSSFTVGSVDHTDIDIATTSDYAVGTPDCVGGHEVGAGFSGGVLTLEFCGGEGASIPSSGTTSIEIGTNALADETGDAQLTNPTAGTYDIAITAGASDQGETVVAIVDTVTVTASVDTQFTFTVAGVAGNATVNGTTTGASTTPTEIEFGELEADTASTAAQDLSVVTNARNGFTVTVESDGQLNSSNGADIDGFANGNYTATPTTWSSPLGTVGSEETYGHWGITSDDTDYFAATETYVSASTTPVEVFSHTGPADGSATGIGTTRVGYTVEISALQEAATDYQATLTYVATPVF